jgi:hypothetical protein
MSIYRKAHVKVLDEIHTTGTPVRPDEEALRADAAHEEIQKRKRSKGEPSNLALPQTLAWAAKLPRDVRPYELIRSFARIANLLAANWHERGVTDRYFDQLLVDLRGNRKGFEPGVHAELVALRRYYDELRQPDAVAPPAQTPDSWEGTRKR